VGGLRGERRSALFVARLGVAPRALRRESTCPSDTESCWVGALVGCGALFSFGGFRARPPCIAGAEQRAIEQLKAGEPKQACINCSALSAGYSVFVQIRVGMPPVQSTALAPKLMGKAPVRTNWGFFFVLLLVRSHCASRLARVCILPETRLEDGDCMCSLG